MNELLHEYTALIAAPNSGGYLAQAWGRQRDDDRKWEGWLVFIPVSGGQPRRTERETTQSTLDQLVYWATGIQRTYLEGALERSMPLAVDSSAA